MNNIQAAAKTSAGHESNVQAQQIDLNILFEQYKLAVEMAAVFLRSGRAQILSSSA